MTAAQAGRLTGLALRYLVTGAALAGAYRETGFYTTTILGAVVLALDWPHIRRLFAVRVQQP